MIENRSLRGYNTSTFTELFRATDGIYGTEG